VWASGGDVDVANVIGEESTRVRLIRSGIRSDPRDGHDRPRGGATPGFLATSPGRDSGGEPVSTGGGANVERGARDTILSRTARHDAVCRPRHGRGWAGVPATPRHMRRVTRDLPPCLSAAARGGSNHPRPRVHGPCLPRVVRCSGVRRLRHLRARPPRGARARSSSTPSPARFGALAPCLG
jgi:hypothetical protein